MSFYSQSEREQLKMQAQVIALNHGIKSRPIAEMLAKLKAKRLTAGDDKTLAMLCEANGIDWGKVKPYKETERGEK